MITNKNILPLHYLNGSSLTAQIQAFCGNFPVIKVAVFNDRNGLEEAALAEAKGKYCSAKLGFQVFHLFCLLS